MANFDTKELQERSFLAVIVYCSLPSVMVAFLVILFDICTGNDYDVSTKRKQKFKTWSFTVYKWLSIWMHVNACDVEWPNIA